MTWSIQDCDTRVKNATHHPPHPPPWEWKNTYFDPFWVVTSVTLLLHHFNMHCIIATIAQDGLMAKVATPFYRMLHISSKLRTEPLKILIVCWKYSNCPLCALFANNKYNPVSWKDIMWCCSADTDFLLQTCYVSTTKLPNNFYSCLQCHHSHREDLDYYWVLALVAVLHINHLITRKLICH